MGMLNQSFCGEPCHCCLDSILVLACTGSTIHIPFHLKSPCQLECRNYARALSRATSQRLAERARECK